MTDSEINSLLNKAEELKALFVLGHRVIPFLEEIFLFVKEIKPMLDEINSSIEDNLKKMPSASKHLSKVTEATETATNEIMDIVDGIIFKSDLITKNLEKISDKNSNGTSASIKILGMIEDAMKEDSDTDKIVDNLSELIKGIKNGGAEFNDAVIKDSKELVESIQNDSNSIMMSLQVQDITSQQIAAVNHLLTTIQAKLNGILGRFKKSDFRELVISHKENNYERTNVSKMHRNIAFDPEAVESISMKENRQREVDEWINAQNSGDGLSEDHSDSEKGSENDSDEIDESASPEDIDALFNGGGIIKDSEESEDDSAASETEDNENDEESEHISQDDIDAIFS